MLRRLLYIIQIIVLRNLYLVKFVFNYTKSFVCGELFYIDLVYINGKRIKPSQHDNQRSYKDTIQNA